MRFWFLEYYEDFDLPMNARYARVRAWRDACIAHPAARQVTKEEIVKLYYAYAKGAGNGALLPGRGRREVQFRAMSTRWKRWTAAVMLLLATATVCASAGALLCTVESGCPVALSANSAHETEGAADRCPLLPLAEVAATPAVLATLVAPSVVLPAYVRALAPDHSYRVDPEPPVKPPAARILAVLVMGATRLR